MTNVCEVLVQLLTEAGVKQIFGVPGDAINSLTEAIRQQKAIQFVHVNHEEAGAFAAVGQAKLTGNLGVCAGTSGPGAIHLLNALYDAKCDRAPVLAITGQVETRMLGSDYQQEIDLLGLFKDVTVYNQTITNAENFPYIVVQAIQAALEQRGVAHLNIPVDIAMQSVPDTKRWHTIFPTRQHLPVNAPELEQAAALLNAHQKIAILAGLGCAGSEEKVFALAEHLGAPIIHALRAKELFTETHPHAIGGIGNLGVKPSVHALAHADLLLMIGTNFPYVEFLPKDITTVQIDLNPRQIGKRVPVDCGIAGDAGLVIDALMPLLNHKNDRAFLKYAQEQKAQWQQEMEKDIAKKSGPIHPGRLAHLVGEAASPDAIFVCDTGEVTAWVARYLRIKPGQRFTVSGLLATMAFSLGAAIGAKFSYPERPVIVLTGDGGFSMLMSDFSTAVKNKLPLAVIVFNNERLGMIQLEQEAKGLPNYETGNANPDFAAFARICGGNGMRITDPTELEAGITQALASPVPFVLDVMIDTDAKIVPPKLTAKQVLNYAVAKVKEIAA